MKEYKITTFYNGEIVTTGWLKSKRLADFGFWLISKFPFITRMDTRDETPSNS